MYSMSKHLKMRESCGIQSYRGLHGSNGIQTGMREYSEKEEQTSPSWRSYFDSMPCCVLFVCRSLWWPVRTHISETDWVCLQLSRVYKEASRQWKYSVMRAVMEEVQHPLWVYRRGLHLQIRKSFFEKLPV